MNSKSNVGWIYKQLKGNRGLLAILSIIVIVCSICSLLIAYILKLFIDVATNQTHLLISDVVLLTIIVLSTGGVMGILCSIVHTKIQCKTELKLRTMIVDTVLNGHLEQVEKMHSADILTKLTDDVSVVSNLFPDIVVKLVGNISMAILATLSLFVLNVKVATTIVIAIPLLIAIVSLFNFPIERVDKQRKNAEENNRILLQEYISKVKVIKIFGAQSKFLSMFIEKYYQLYSLKIKFSIWEGVASFCNSLIGNAMILITLGLGSYLVLNGETSLGALIAMVQMLNYVINPFSKISAEFSKIAQASASVERIKELMHIERIEENKVESANNIQYEMLSIKNVSFGYSENNILENINMTFHKNKVYCIQGDNGSGKSTLLNVISGLYKPQVGEIFLASGEGKKITDNLSSGVSLLPSNETLFNGTIRDNITLFSQEYNKEYLKKVEESTNIQSVIKNQAEGYDTNVLENGRSLSSGQIQQVAMCRALYHKSDIILFDEPTANLDNESVEIFKEMIRNIKENRIIIIVTHDENIIDCCDYSYKLSNNKIVPM